MKSFVIVMGGFLIVAAAVVGCEKAEKTEVKETASAPAAPVEPLPANLFATTAPANAVDVVTAKKAIKDGDAVVIKGHIGGAVEPLAKNRAIMTIADASLPTCDKSPMDKCETPWDSCCEPAEEIVAKSLSVQVVGADGRPLKVGLTGIQGAAPKKQVIVAGTARKSAGSDAMVIEAKQIYVSP